MTSTEYLISVLVTAISFIITISTTGIAIVLIRHFLSENKPIPQKYRSRSNSEIVKQSNRVKTKRYFKVTASITLIFNALNTCFNSLYCLYLLFDSVRDDNEFYVHHPSHYQRITSTASWYVAKVSLVWFFSGRLHNAFKGSALSINRRLLLLINSVNTIFAPSSLCAAYWFVYKKDLICAEIAFNSWRLAYQIVAFFLLWQFCHRLLFLTVQRESMSIMERRASANTNKLAHQQSNSTIEDIHIYSGASKEHRLYFLMITTRNAVLVFTTSFTVLLVSFSFFSFRFVFGQQTRKTLLVPMNMAAFDSLVTSLCIVCLFSYGDNIYDSICKLCDKTVYKLFAFWAKKEITASTSSLALKENIPKISSMDKINSFSPDELEKNKMDTNVLKSMELHIASNESGYKSSSVPLAERSIDLHSYILEIDSFSEPVRGINNSEKRNQSKSRS